MIQSYQIHPTTASRVPSEGEVTATMKDIMRNALRSIEQRNRKLLRELIFFTYLTGINVTTPSRAKNWLKLVNFSLVICCCCGLYGQYCFVVKHFEESFTTYIECICTSFQCILPLTKLIYALHVQKRLHYFLETVQTSKIVQQLEIFDMGLSASLKIKICDDITAILRDSWLLIRRQLVVYTSSVLLITSWYLLSALIINSYHQIIGSANYTIQTSFPSYFPKWESKQFQFPYYELQYLFAGSETYTAGTVAISFDGIFIVLTLHGMALFRILHVIIRYSTHASIEPHLRVTYLRECIHHFERSYEYYEQINTLYKFICLPQFGISLFIMGMVLFQANVGLQTDMKMFIKMCLYIAAGGLAVFVYCYNGQKFTTESEMLNFSWYDCDWYQESKEFKQLIKMMILRANRMMPMEVSGITTMTLMTFVSLAQTSGSYFLLLKNVQGEF